MDLSTSNSYYPAGALYKQVIIDPNGNKSITYTDKAGRVVMQRQANNTETQKADTYTVYDDAGLVGYANVHRNPTPWMRRVGEIRVNVAPQYRSRGLGRLLISRIFDIARELELKKIIAQMIADQRGAQSAFRKLGFVPEAMLADFVVDRNDVTRDLVMMTFDVDGHTDQAGDVLQI